MGKWIDCVSDRFDLPASVAMGSPKITINGRTGVLVENHRSLLVYTKELVSLDCGTVTVTVRGDELQLRAMDKTGIYVTGTIFGVDTE